MDFIEFIVTAFFADHLASKQEEEERAQSEKERISSELERLENEIEDLRMKIDRLKEEQIE